MRFVWDCPQVLSIAVLSKARAAEVRVSPAAGLDRHHEV